MKLRLETLVLVTGVALGMVLGPSALVQADDTATGRVAVGDKAPAIALPDISGTVYRSTDLRGEKNLVVVFFRGAW